MFVFVVCVESVDIFSNFPICHLGCNWRVNKKRKFLHLPFLQFFVSNFPYIFLQKLNKTRLVIFFFTKVIIDEDETGKLFIKLIKDHISTEVFFSSFFFLIIFYILQKISIFFLHIICTNIIQRNLETFPLSTLFSQVKNAKKEPSFQLEF